ncbi:bifunctional [glutamine synthetase] adenylyltransferase/[glutamine synthetase]-adenylyl-L-tyrosine phosphorylase [Nocardioides sp. zg-579]|uniref:Bifunctional glutamine synthetase adenylyltransferase/adenylyl-removing enzyme n=1 Tax=Nocardioides marmotae TaxID=2663857 RepID=A0A6I3JE88_9ACTN|nr:bifunctional [glutamine synthetase] adenylyltransferase/[glutamine synthetase]-adenylyl-L-tyrosine phosphorylase [Nocardioides marmotae]MCR6032782.1 bifunctional [glutamine synthetase] adenylyltransferase/[glutamine synthetase]-adenylyl-L-tyrosine phosphorylase [Gordonia jinghuaiqii]MTB96432.1 bifunctional [glutamine synthetase] adenylyltransferase/[glutamine synthetase]-adenylyl-L-tyrosine phosphorylase [Nocardioides marmotae]QKE02041.1 bifunctional [glutamine synthetase] adenylyltransferase
MNRKATSKGALLRLGFLDPEAALAHLHALGPTAEELLHLLSRTADPDLALGALVRLAEALAEAGDDPAAMVEALADDEGTAMRLLCVLGASAALGDHLCRHPEHWRELTDPTLGSTRPAAYALRASLLASVGADPDAAEPVATLPDAQALDALRVEYRRLLLRLAARDLAHALGVDDAAAELSDLAAGTLEAALAVARQRVGAPAGLARLAVIAMGKCGGHELNYVSDVDVVFVHETAEGAEDHAALRAATQLASNLMQVCSDQTAEGTIWPVDAALRPEGKAGPLTRTLASHQGYYERWAKTWEFQALLKARPVAGDRALGAAYVEMVSPMVWSAAEREGFVADTRAMRRRVVEHIPAREADRQLKLGSGGLRDVEFAVQLLQLVHGRGDEAIRATATLSALAELTRGGYVGREDGEALHEAYAFLRALEHRIQLFQLRRTHVVPEDEEAMRRLGRSMGYLRDSAAALDKEWQHHRREVRRLHEKIFYRPLLEAVAAIPGPGVRLSTAAAGERLAALGFFDAQAALRHLEALTSGVSRRATIQRALLPVMLQWFSEGPDPDSGLFGFRRISEALGDSHWYLKMLRDEGQVAQRLALVLSRSRYATSLLEREPQGVRILGEDLAPIGAEALVEEMAASAHRQQDLEKAVRAVRAVRRRELFRIAAGDLVGHTGVDTVGAALSRLTDATLEVTLDVVGRDVARQRGFEEPPTRIAIVAMGRYGGFELSYGSDADVLFVHEPVPGADPQRASSYAQAVVNELRRLLALPGGDPPLVVDADLRPEGRQGAMVRTLDSYAAYYAKWSMVWEAQALLRADAAVGDLDLRRRFEELIDPLRFPEDGISEDDVLEVRRIKARVDRERLPRGADPQMHLKLGRGGLADIEWTVQLLQMRHAGQVAGLRTTRTMEALDAARDAGLLDAADADVLQETWRHVSRTRNAVTLVRGTPSDQLPRDARERAAVASILGYPTGETDAMVNDHLRRVRRATAVVDRVFWG